MVDQLLTVIEGATGITCNSNSVKPGYIFVAITGKSEDGNQYAAAAAGKGAVAVISDNPGRLPRLEIPVIVVSNARKALAELAARFFRFPSNSLKLVGVTGSNGKTTIAHMLEHILSFNGLRTGLIGTVHVKFGQRLFPSKLTTPSAPELQSYLADMRDTGVTHAVMEVSAQGMELHRTDYTRYACGILTNVCPDHLDFHGSFESYLSSKAKFVELLGSHAPLIVNIDDHFCKEIMSQFTGQIITCSTKSTNAHFFLSSVQNENTGLSITVRQNCSFLEEKDDVLLKVPLLGTHNAENVLLSYAASRFLGLKSQRISEALKVFPGVERRMNIFQYSGISVIDDTALNPGSINAVFDTVRHLRYSNIFVVNAIRGSRGPGINALNAETIAEWKRKIDFRLIITSSSERVASKDTVSYTECQTFVDVLYSEKTSFEYFENLGDSLRHVARAAKPGDLVILIGAQGMDDGRELFSQYITQEFMKSIQPLTELQYT